MSNNKRPQRSHGSTHSVRRPDSRREYKDTKPRRPSEELWIYGHHAVAAVLSNPQRKIMRLIATPEAAAKLNKDKLVQRQMIAHMKNAERAEIDTIVGAEKVHQGIAILTRPIKYELSEIITKVSINPEACVIALDQITDPHNIGAVLRSAATFRCCAVIAPNRHAPDETGAMAKAASGALDKVPYVKAVNLVRALKELKEAGFWVVGLSLGEPKQLSDIRLRGRIVLVLGAEGKGLRRLVSENCDYVASLPISSDMESLNVSNAAAIAMYEKARQSPET